MKSTAPGTELAETLALRALAFILSSDQEKRAFTAQTGTDGTDLRDRVADPVFLGHVLDFILSDEKRLISFCINAEIDESEPSRARLALPGSTQQYW